MPVEKVEGVSQYIPIKEERKSDRRLPRKKKPQKANTEEKGEKGKGIDIRV